MKTLQKGLLLAGLVLIAGVAAAEQDEPRFSIAAGAEYTTGTYGGLSTVNSTCRGRMS